MTTPDRMMFYGTVRALSFADQMKATQAAGCQTFAITPEAYVKALAHNISTKDILQIASDNGVKITHLDPYSRWVSPWKPSDYFASFPYNFFGFEEEDIFRFIDALGLESLSAIITCSSSQIHRDALLEGFSKLCDRAERAGVRCDLEFMPYFGLPDLASAWDIVSTTDRKNAGIVFDFFHYFRGTPNPELLGSIPGDRITIVQICDGDEILKPGRAKRTDSILYRLPPLDGGFPIASVMKQLYSIGGLSRMGPEIFSGEFDLLRADEIGERCVSSIQRLLKEAEVPIEWPSNA